MVSRYSTDMNNQPRKEMNGKEKNKREHGTNASDAFSVSIAGAPLLILYTMLHLIAYPPPMLELDHIIKSSSLPH